LPDISDISRSAEEPPISTATFPNCLLTPLSDDSYFAHQFDAERSRTVACTRSISASMSAAVARRSG
jgi:hypothetical protein